LMNLATKLMRSRTELMFQVVMVRRIDFFRCRRRREQTGGSCWPSGGGYWISRW
jgi:hypothetical protein